MLTVAFKWGNEVADLRLQGVRGIHLALIHLLHELGEFIYEHPFVLLHLLLWDQLQVFVGGVVFEQPLHIDQAL